MSTPPVAARRVPEQSRSRVRVERILDAAASLIAETGVDGMTMSALADAADVSLPSVYRYFTGKRAIVESLAEQYAGRVREQLVAAIGPVTDPAEARQAVASAMEAYWQLYRDDPAFAAVWSATVADPELAHLDVADSRRNGALVAGAIGPVVGRQAPADLEVLAFLASHLAGTAVRLAVLLEPEEAETVIAAMVDRVLPALLGLDG